MNQTPLINAGTATLLSDRPNCVTLMPTFGITVRVEDICSKKRRDQTSGDPHSNAGGPVPMTMAEQNLVSHLLDGMVHCRKCNTPIATAGESFGEMPKYVCPNSWENCDTPEIPAEPFTRLVVERVIRAALEGENTQRVAAAVKADARRRRRIERWISWSRLTLYLSRRPPRFDKGRHLPKPYPTDLDLEMERLMDLDPDKYIGPLNRLDQYWSTTGDTGQIEEYALDLDTYLRPTNLHITRAIMDTSVDEIQVGRGSATIRYRIPMPPGSGVEGRSQEEVDLPSR